MPMRAVKVAIKFNVNIAIIGIIAILGACASTKGAQTSQNARTKTSVGSAANTIVSQPFRDLGFMKKEIPAALAQITDPYATPEGMDCPWIEYQISQLDAVLGVEQVRSSTIDDRTLAQKSDEAVAGATNDVVRSAATSIMPSRSIVRRLSGAAKSDSEYNAAVERGKIRRGYLRGLSHAKNCARPNN